MKAYWVSLYTEISDQDNLKKYGGFGYTYILTHFKKILLSVGVTNEQINEILINNPRKVFSFDTG